MNWAIGDIQGCFDNLDKLLKKINFNFDKDKLWLVGDIVNRGKKSLEVLEFVYEHQDRINLVLGNHDIGLIAAFYNLRPSNETIEPILSHKNANKYINWLRSQPFLHIDYALGYVMAHAGIAPQFDLENAIYYNLLLQGRLSSIEAKEWLEKIFAKETKKYHTKASLIEEERYALNSFIRMRYCYKDGRLDFKQKGAPKDVSKKLYPWFDCPNRKKIDLTILFGHWSTLGLLQREDVICIDTGCVWGRYLSAISLETQEIVQVECKKR